MAVSADWLGLARIARILSWLTLAWMGIEGGVAIAAAVIADSPKETMLSLSGTSAASCES